MKRIIVAVLLMLSVYGVRAQQSFLDNQKLFPKVGVASGKKRSP